MRQDRISANAAAVRTEAPRGLRPLAGVALAGLVALAVLLRLVPVVFAPSLNWGDEVFQTIEPAHRLVYGYGLVTWEFQLGLRSWLFPAALAGLIEVARVLGDGPEYYLTTIAVALGLLATAPVVCVFGWCRREFGLAGAFVAATAVAVAPELVYFGARALNEVVAAHLLVIALYLGSRGDASVGDQRRRRDIVAGALLGLVCLLRLQLAPAAAVIALWPQQGGRRAWRARFFAMLAGGLAMLAFGAAFDWLTLGYPFASVWRNVYYNLYLGISAGFSVAPWFYYLAGELAVWGEAAPLVLLLVGLGARRFPLLLVTAIVLIAVHSLIPHKEYRFIYPAVVLLMLLAAMGLAQLACWGEEWLRKRRSRPAQAAAAAPALLLIAVWCATAYGAWSSGTMAALRQRAHNELVAMSFVRDLPKLCGVGLYGKNAWVRYGGYTWLHRRVAMLWPDDPAALTAAAPAFDTLLYDSQEQNLPPPPANLGYARVHCVGTICVARRSGACEPQAPPAMWFPPELRGSEPSADRFAPLPDRSQ